MVSLKANNKKAISLIINLECHWYIKYIEI